MAPLMFLAVFWMFTRTHAIPCSDSEHCSVCDEKTGECPKCDRGYWGNWCSLKCSSGCRNNTCSMTVDGIERCTTGCVPGFQGTSCTVPCDPPAGNCTQCPGGCEEAFCQIGSFCVSGCVDSYHGSDCRPCSSRCRSCNRITGACEECHHPFVGGDCQYSCTNCSGSCESGCVKECSSRYPESFCIEPCSEHCVCPLNCTDVEMVSYCTPSFRNHSNRCTNGCVDGWYGSLCSSRCEAGCINQRCDLAGACVDGCQDGYFGTNCKACSERCFNRTCDSNTGSCTNGCSPGWYGRVCGQTCDVCRDALCDQRTGTCIKGCTIRGCESSCSSNCSIEECRAAESCKSVPKTNSVIIGILGVIIGILAATMFCTALTRCVRHRRHIAANRRSQLATVMSGDLRQVSLAGLGYRDLHRYCELHDEDWNPGLHVSEAKHDYQVVHIYSEIYDEDPELPTNSTNNMVDIDNGEKMGELAKEKEEEGASEVGEVAVDESEPAAASAIAEYFPVSSDVKDEIAESREERKGERMRMRMRMRMRNWVGKVMGKEVEPAIPTLAECWMSNDVEEEKGEGREERKRMREWEIMKTRKGKEVGKEVEDAIPTLTECFPVSSDVKERDATSGPFAEGDTSGTGILRDVFADNPKTVVTYLTPREEREGERKWEGEKDEERVSEVAEEESGPAAAGFGESFLMSSIVQEEEREMKGLGGKIRREMEPAMPTLTQCFMVSSDVEEDDSISGFSVEDDAPYTPREDSQ